MLIVIPYSQIIHLGYSHPTTTGGNHIVADRLQTSQLIEQIMAAWGQGAAAGLRCW